MRSARRRELLHGLFGVAAVAALGSACSSANDGPSASSRKYRVGYLTPRWRGCVVSREWEVAHGVAIKTVQTRPPASCPDSSLLQALEERGYRQGENLEWLPMGPVQLTEQSAGGSDGDLAQPAAYLAARHVDIIVAQGENAAIAARQATTTIPIVLNNVDDAVEIGLVPSRARPGGNITGVSVRTADVAIKRVEALKEAFPWVKRPILVYGSARSHIAAIGPAMEAARQLGLSAVAIQFAPGSCRPSVESKLEVDVHLQNLTAPQRAAAMTGAYAFEQPGPLLLCSGNEWSDFYTNIRQALDAGADAVVVIAALSAPGPLALIRGWRLPGVFPTTEYLGDGLGVGAICLRESTDLSVVVAAYVDRLLRGAQPADLPIVSPTTFELVVDLRLAEALGLKIAPGVLAGATRVIR